MANIEEIRAERLKKLKKIGSLGVNPYPIKTSRTDEIFSAVENFSDLSKRNKIVVLAGRILSLRGHGGLIFGDINDGTGKIQLAFKKDKLGERNFQLLEEIIDVGDFIETKGILFKTKVGEKTLAVDDFKIIAKSLRPLPEKWHGLQDMEERYRKRYLDLIFNNEVKEKFEIRSRIISSVREFLENQGFLEVETPILQPIYGGARAKPFKTHLNAMDIDLYLRISPELYLKRLIVGGFPKVYEIGKCFRNEGVDKHHNPDFTILEFYWAYADYKDMMKLIEEMFQFVLKKIFKKTKIEYEGKEIDFKAPWQRIEFNDLIHKYTKIKIGEINRAGIFRKAGEMGVKVPSVAPKAEIADEIYKKFCRPKIWQPTFVIHHPKGFQPLAKTLEGDEGKLATLQLVAAGIELINAFSELNDPQEQKERFEEQEKLFKQGLNEAQRKDDDFIEALEYGMPPTAGFGMGIDRLAALLTNSHSLREVILFPTMRSKS